MSKLIVVTAPSGAGKTTIVHHILEKYKGRLAFSVSATTREKRKNEEEGVDYYYINVEKFKQLIAEDAFLEWQEVYENQFYGTLKSEVRRLWDLGKCVIFDIDVKGALNLKKAFPKVTLTVFIKPPSKEVLVNRLLQRRSENEESFRKRITKATEELAFEKYFDIVLVNDTLEIALKEAEEIVADWLND